MSNSKYQSCRVYINLSFKWMNNWNDETRLKKKIDLCLAINTSSLKATENYYQALNSATNLFTGDPLGTQSFGCHIKVKKVLYVQTEIFLCLSYFYHFPTFVFSSAERGSLRCSSLSISRSFLRSFLTFRSTSIFSVSAIADNTGILEQCRQEKQNRISLLISYFTSNFLSVCMRTKFHECNILPALLYI